MISGKQRQFIRQARQTFIQTCKAVVRAAQIDIGLHHDWVEGDEDGPSPVDPGMARLRLQYAMRAQLMTHWGLPTPDHWLRVIYGLPEPEPAD